MRTPFKKRFILWAFLLVALLGVLLCVIFSLGGPVEPVYKGKRLTYWFRHHYETGNSKSEEERDEAIKEIGTNGIPTYLWLLQASDPGIKARLARWAEKLPWIHYTYWGARSRNEAGAKGFEILKEDGQSAVGELIRIMELHISDGSEEFTMEALGHVGPRADAAVPALLQRMAGTNDYLRWFAMSALGHIHTRPGIVVPAIARELRNADSDLQRSAAGALAMFGTNASAAVPELVAGLNATNFLLRESFIKALGSIKTSPEIVLPALLAQINETNEWNCWEAAKALSSFGTNAGAAVPALLTKLASTNEEVRHAVCQTLGEIHSNPELAVPVLIRTLDDNDTSMQRQTAIALACFGTEASVAVPELLGHLSTTNVEFRYWIIFALGEVHSSPEVVVPRLIRALDETEFKVQSVAADALAKFGPDADAAVPALLNRLTNGIADRRRINAAFTVGEIHTRPDTAIPALISTLGATNIMVRAAAAYALGEFGTNAKPAVELLIKMKETGQGPEQRWAAKSLKQIDPERFDKNSINGATKSP